MVSVLPVFCIVLCKFVVTLFYLVELKLATTLIHCTLHSPDFAAVIYDVNLCFGRPNNLSRVMVAYTLALHSQVYAAFETSSGI